MIRLAVRRKSAAAHIFAISADCFGNYLANIRILARELRCLVEGEAKHIVYDEDLAVAVRAGSDADRRNAQLAGNLRAKLARHRLQHDAEAPGRSHSARVQPELFRGGTPLA